MEERVDVAAPPPEEELDRDRRRDRRRGRELVAPVPPAGEPGERQGDQEAVRAQQRGGGTERRGEERALAQDERRRPGRGGEREPVRVGEQQGEGARPAGEGQRRLARPPRGASGRDAEEGERAGGEGDCARELPVRDRPRGPDQPRPEREERVAPVGDGGVAVLGDPLVPAEVPREEREQRCPRHRARPVVGAGGDPDRDGRDDRPGPDHPDPEHRNVRTRKKRAQGRRGPFGPDDGGASALHGPKNELGGWDLRRRLGGADQRGRAGLACATA